MLEYEGKIDKVDPEKALSCFKQFDLPIDLERCRLQQNSYETFNLINSGQAVRYEKKTGNSDSRITDKWCNQKWKEQDAINDVDGRSEPADQYMSTQHGDDCQPIKKSACPQFKYDPDYCDSNQKFQGDNRVACLFLIGHDPGRHQCLINDAATSPKYEF